MKQCVKCQQDIDDSCVYCPHCGTAQYQESDTTQCSDNVAEPDDFENQEKVKSIDVKDVFNAVKQLIKDFVHIIIHPDDDVALGKISLVILMIVEFLFICSFMDSLADMMANILYLALTFVNSLTSIFINYGTSVSIIGVLGAGLLFFGSLVLIFILTIFIGTRTFSLNKAISHALVPSVSLFIASLCAQFVSISNTSGLVFWLAFVLLGLLAILMHVVADLKVQNFYIRIVVTTLVACLIVIVLTYSIELLLSSVQYIQQNPTNNFYGHHI